MLLPSFQYRFYALKNLRFAIKKDFKLLNESKSITYFMLIYI